MRYNDLGRTGLKVRELCLGTMTFGQQNNPSEGFKQLDRALEAGINFLDTAEMYPIPPSAETSGNTVNIIGKWLQKKIAARMSFWQPRSSAKATGCRIVGARSDNARIPGIDIQLAEGECFNLGPAESKVISVSGHTRGHIAYWFHEQDALFCGDTLFAMGCGRLFEGTPAQMWDSLSKLKQLPGSTRVYCAHEYTQANGRFALTVEPKNQELQLRMQRVNRMRKQNLSTVPSTLAEELETNPFLRVDILEIQKTLNVEAANPVDVFAEIRRKKDHFR